MKTWTEDERTALAAHLIEGAAVCVVPSHLREGFYRYILDGILPGSFLQAVLCADLLEVAWRADPVSLQGLPALLQFLEHYAPADCWRSRAAVLAWTSTPERIEIPERWPDHEVDVDRKTFDAMRTSCIALGWTVDDLEQLTTPQFAALYDAFAGWWNRLPRRRSTRES